MSLDFGKLNFSTSFNPTSAFPLDARSYFESYSAAVEAARTAVEAGGTDSVYYYGQTLVVVEDGIANFYIIQPDGTLSVVAGDNEKIAVNSKVFEYNENNDLNLVGFDQADIGALLTKNAEGSLSWAKPIDAYTKKETDDKINQAVTAASHLKRKVVGSLDEAKQYIANNDDADQYIYMVPTGLEVDDDKYDEYIVVIVADIPTLEKVGSWEVDLSGYAKTADVNAALALKVDIAAGQRLMTEIEGAKLASIQEGAQVNIINSISTDFTIDANKKLSLNNININKVNGLQEALNKKVDAIEGYALLSPTDQKKLDALTFDDIGDLVISGTVNADNVQELDSWIAEHAGTVVGLSENNLTDELYTKLVNSLSISSIDVDELDVSAEGKLSIIKVDSSKVTGLQEALNNKVNTDVYNKKMIELDVQINALSDNMDNYVEKTQYEEDINEIWDRLSWKDI